MALNLPVITGNAGIGDLVATMREPRYLELLGKCVSTGFGAGVLMRRLPSGLAAPVVLLAGIYIGLEMAAWMEEEAAAKRGPVIDVTPVEMFHVEQSELSAD
jgi:hypothetical protein